MITIPSKAPDFCLPNQDDTEICLRDLQGKWVILYFYPKDNTPGCTNEACDFTAAIPEFEGLNAAILGVSADSTKAHRNFIAKHDLKITLLSDADTQMMQSYGVWQLKKNYGKEYMGIVRTTLIINPEGEIVHGWENVKVRQKRKKNGEQYEIFHVDVVKEQLSELQG